MSLFFDVAVADVGEAEGWVGAIAQDFGDGAADGSEADESDAGGVGGFRQWVGSRWKMISYHTCERRFWVSAKVEGVVAGESKAFERKVRKGKAAKFAKRIEVGFRGAARDFAMYRDDRTE